jgi:hypothetical protein
MPIDEKPSRNEEEYFARRNAELIAEQRAKLDQSRQQRERASHFMKCPRCGADLKEREYHHVRIDECSECGGMWLDKASSRCSRTWTGARSDASSARCSA